MADLSRSENNHLQAIINELRSSSETMQEQIDSLESQVLKLREGLVAIDTQMLYTQRVLERGFSAVKTYVKVIAQVEAHLAMRGFSGVNREKISR